MNKTLTRFIFAPVLLAVVLFVTISTAYAQTTPIRVGYESSSYMVTKSARTARFCVRVYEPASGGTPEILVVSPYFIEGGTAIDDVDYYDDGGFDQFVLPTGTTRSCDFIDLTGNNTALSIGRTIPLRLRLDNNPTNMVTIDPSATTIFIRGNDATLSELSLSDTTTSEAIALSPAFASSTLTYNAEDVDLSVTNVDVRAVVNDVAVSLYDGATYTISVNGAPSGDSVNLIEGANVVEIVVTSNDDSQTKTYTININRGPTPVRVGYEFQDYQSNYVTGSVTACAVITEPASGAPAPFTLSASVGGGTAISGDDYHPVQNEHLIFAKGNRRQCHTISFINDPPDRAKYFINTLSLVSSDPSIAVTIDPATAAGIIWGNDATLRELALFDATTSNVISLSPAFASSNIMYNLTVANSVLNVDIRAIVNDQVMSAGLPGHLIYSDSATYQVRVNDVDVETSANNRSRANLEVGANTVHIVVTSDDSQEILTYIIHINRRSPPIPIRVGYESSSFVVTKEQNDVEVCARVYEPASGGTPEVFSLTASIIEGGTAVVDVDYQPFVEASLHFPTGTTSKCHFMSFTRNAALSIGKTIPLGLTLRSRSLNSIITIDPSATTIFIRGNDATLSELSLSDTITSDTIALSPAFASSTLTYNADVVGSVSSVNIRAIVNDLAVSNYDGATYTISVNGAPSGDSVNLIGGANVVEIVVTSNDDSQTKTYTININYAPPIPIRVGYEHSSYLATKEQTSVGACFRVYEPASGGTPELFIIEPYFIEGGTAIDGVDYYDDGIDARSFTIGTTRRCLNIDLARNSALSIGRTIPLGLRLLGNPTNMVTIDPSATTIFIRGNDARLSELSLSDTTTSEAIALSPAFASSTLTYNADISVPSVDIRAIVNDLAISLYDGATYTISVNGAPSGDSVNLIEGANVVEIVVTSNDESQTKTYTISLYRGLPRVNVGYEFFFYNSTYELGSVTTCAIIYEPADGIAPAAFTLSVSTGGGNAIAEDDYNPVQNELLVFAQGDRRQCHTVNFINNPPDRGKYFINTLSLVSSDSSIAVTVTQPESGVYIHGNDATLSELSLSDTASNAITLSPAFASSTLTYNANVSVSSVNIRAIVNDLKMPYTLINGESSTDEPATYQVKVNDVDVDTNIFSSSRANLIEGANVVEIVVTPSDSSQTKTYTININRTISSDTNLRELSIAGATLHPTFTPSTLFYTTSLTSDMRIVDVRLVAANPEATISRGGTTPVTNGVDTINVMAGASGVFYQVRAEDGTTKDYTLTFSRASSQDLTLDSLILSDNVVLNPAFSSLTNVRSWNVSVASNIRQLDIELTTLDPLASITRDGSVIPRGVDRVNIEVGDNTFVYQVRAEDTTFVDDYTLTISRSAGPPVANTARAQRIYSSENVILDASASSSEDGTITSYSWVQSSGSTVTLSNENTAIATFTAPNVEVETDLTFMLTVTNSHSLSASSTIVITILPVVEVVYEHRTYEISENDPTIPLCVLVTNQPETFSPLTLSVSTLDNSASAPEDYTEISDERLILNPGDTSLCFSVNIIDDAILEAREKFTVILSVVDDGGNRVVIPEDGRTATVIIQDDEVHLNDLSILGDTTLNPAFASSTMAYTAEVPNNRERLTITPSAHPSLVIRRGEIEIPSGSADSVDLAVGENNIEYAITAGDGETIATYIIAITRTANTAPVIADSTTTTINFPENSIEPIATYSATDDGENTITWSLSGVDASYFTIDSNGVLRFREPQDFEDVLGARGSADYLITIIASDGAMPTPARDMRDITVRLTNVDELGRVNVIIVGGGGMQVGEEIAVSVRDPDSQRTRNQRFQWEISSNGIDYTPLETNSPRYILTEDDIGKTFRMVWTYNDSAGSDDRRVTSAPTVAVASADALGGPIIALTQDSGIFDDDGITNNNQVTVTLAVSATMWQYTNNNGRDFLDGEGVSFILDEGIYAANQVQVRQTVLGRQSVISSLGGVTIDTTGPTVLSVTSSTPNGTYKEGDEINITLNLNEPVQQLGIGGFASIPSLRHDLIVDLFTDTKNTMTLVGTFVVEAGYETSDIVLNFMRGTARVFDLAGNEMAASDLSTPEGEKLSDNSDIVIDATPPTILSITSTTPNGTYKEGDNINITATFNEEVSDNSQLAVFLLESASPSISSRLVLVKDTPNTLVATYLVAAGANNDALSLTVQSDLVPTDAIGNEMTDFSIPEEQNLADTSDIILDTSAPIATFSNIATLFVNSQVMVTLSFSEYINRNLNTNDFTITNIRGAPSLSRSGDDYILTFTPDNPDLLTITFHGGVTDLVGNVAASVVVNSQVAPAPPSAPIDFSGFGEDMQITLSWNAPDSNGGAPITKYQYRVRTAGDSYDDMGPTGWRNFASAIPTGLTESLVGFPNNIELFFQVRALNIAGFSEPSEEIILFALGIDTPVASNIRVGLTRESAAQIASDGVAIVTEGDTVFFALTLDGELPHALLVPVDITGAQNSTSGAGAVYGTSDNDYTINGLHNNNNVCGTIISPATGTFVCLPAGAVNRAISVAIRRDGASENPETFIVSLPAEPIIPQGQAPVLRSFSTAKREVSTLIKGGLLEFGLLTNLFVFPENRQTAQVFITRRSAPPDLARMFKGRTDTGTDRTLTIRLHLLHDSVLNYSPSATLNIPPIYDENGRITNIIITPDPPPVLSIRLLSKEEIAANPEMSENNHYVERIVNSQTPTAFSVFPVYTDDFVAAEPTEIADFAINVPRHELDDYEIDLSRRIPQANVTVLDNEELFVSGGSGETEITEGQSATFTITTGGQGPRQAFLERNAYAFTQVKTGSSGCAECDWEEGKNAELANDFTSDTGIVTRLLTLDAEPPANTRGTFDFAVADDLVYDPDEYFWIDICGFIAANTQSYLKRDPVDLTNPGFCPSAGRGTGEVLFDGEGFKVKIIDNSPIPTLTLEPRSPSSVNMVWDIANPNNLPIDKWQYRVKPSGDQAFSDEENTLYGWTDIEDSTSADGVAGAHSEQFSLNELNTNTSYSAQVRLVVGSEYGRPSAEQTSTTPQGVIPDSPILSATPGNQQVFLSWTKPYGGGLEIQSYKVASGTPLDGLDDFMEIEGSDADTITLTISNLNNNQAYIFEVLAVNVMGDSLPSNRVSARPMPAIPNTPVLQAFPGNRQVRLEWSPVSGNGDVVIKYQYRQRTASETFVDSDGAPNGWQDFNDNPIAPTQTLGGLTNDTTYFFQVRAVNITGASLPSNENSLTPRPTLPEALTLRVIRGIEQLTLDWEDPNDETFSITGYEYRQSEASGDYATSPWIPIEGGATLSEYVISPLNNNTLYYFQIRAINSAGEGAPSVESSNTPRALPSVTSFTLPDNLAPQVPSMATITFSEAVDGLGVNELDFARDFDTTNANINSIYNVDRGLSYTGSAVPPNNFASSSTNFVITFTPQTLGVVSISVNSEAVRAAGFFNDQPFSATGVAEEALTLSFPALGTSTLGNIASVEITFSEGVSGLRTNDFIATNAVVNTVANSVSQDNGQGSTYIITYTPTSAGEVILTLTAGSVMSSNRAGPVLSSSRGMALVERVEATGARFTARITMNAITTDQFNEAMFRDTAVRFLKIIDSNVSANANDVHILSIKSRLVSAGTVASPDVIVYFEVVSDNFAGAQRLVGSYTGIIAQNLLPAFTGQSIVTATSTPPEAKRQATLADAPRNLRVMALAEGARLTWDAPENNGGSVVSRYQYRQRTGSEIFIDTLGALNGWQEAGVESPYAIAGLTAGNAYFFQVRAVNEVGASTSSLAISTTPLVQPILILELKGAYPETEVSDSADGATRDPINYAREIEVGGQQVDLLQFHLFSSPDSMRVRNVLITRTDPGTSPDYADNSDFMGTPRFSGGDPSNIMFTPGEHPVVLKETLDNNLQYELAIVNDDNLIETTESLSYEASYEYQDAAGNWVPRTIEEATFTIENFDHGTIDVAQSVVMGIEGRDVEVVFALSKRASFPVKVTWEVMSVASSTVSADDYTLPANNFVILDALQSEGILTIPIVSDDDDTEPRESFAIRITGITKGDDSPIPSGYTTGRNDDDRSTEPLIVVGSDNVVTINIFKTDAKLSDLVLIDDNNVNLGPVNLDSLSEDSGVLTYTENVLNSVRGIRVTPSASDADNALISLNEEPIITGTTSDIMPLSIGTNTINIQVIADDGVTTLNYVLTIIRAPNTMPIIDTTNMAVEVAENTTFVAGYALDPASIDVNEVIIWSLSGEDSAAFNIDEVSGTLSFNTAKDYENPTDANMDNIYLLTIKATDNGFPAMTNTLDVSVTITNVNEDGLVTISGITREGEVLTASLSDPDGGVRDLTWQWERINEDFTRTIIATNAIYTITSENVDRLLNVTASYTDILGAGNQANAITNRVISQGAVNVTSAILKTSGNPGYAKVGDTLTLEFELSATPTYNPAVTMAGEVIISDAVAGFSNKFRANYTILEFVDLSGQQGKVIYDIGQIETRDSASFNPPAITSDIIIDTITPEIDSVTSTTPSGRYKAGDEVNITLNLSEHVLITAPPSTFTLLLGEKDVTTGDFIQNKTLSLRVSPTNTMTLVGTLLVVAGDYIDDLGHGNMINGILQDFAGNENDALVVPSGQSLHDNKDIALDTTPPTITLIGEATVTLFIGETYTEAGITIMDAEPGLSATIGGDAVDTTSAGRYIITYNIADTAGNVATQITRSVIVQEPKEIIVGYEQTNYQINEQIGSVEICALITSQATATAPFTLGVSSSDGSAIAPEDYEAIENSQIIFNIGDNRKCHSISIINDDLPEERETFITTLSLVDDSDLGITVSLNPKRSSTTLSIEGNDAVLTRLSIAQARLNPVFSSEITKYRASVLTNTTDIVINLQVPSSASNTIKRTLRGISIDLMVADDNTVSDMLSGILGGVTNTLTYTVFAEDGTMKTYTIDIIYIDASSSDATLNNLDLLEASLSPTFEPSVITYTAEVPNSVTSVNIALNKGNPIAVITRDGVEILLDLDVIDLAVGENELIYVVTSVDMTSMATYTITIIRAEPSSDASLTSLVLLDGITLNPTFTPETNEYTASVENDVVEAAITLVANYPLAVITRSGNTIPSDSTDRVSLEVGKNELIYVVTAEDMTTSLDYTITITRKPIAPTIALFEDTGVDNDGITNNGVITVSNLEDGATWQYSTNDGASFTQGGAISSGASSFVLVEGVYSADQVQVRQIISDVTSTIASLSEITLDTTLPIIAIATPTLNIARDTSYIPTATINERGTLEISGDTLNTEVLGTYNITFTATDIATNSATATQVIIVGPTTPSAPRDLSATPGNGEVSLSWNVPDDDGESPITGYKIASKEADGVFSNFESIVGSNAETQTYTATDLTNGVTYTFKILAINSVGDGAESNEASAVPVPTQVTVGYEFTNYQTNYDIGVLQVCVIIYEPADGVAPAPFTLSVSTGGGTAIPDDDYHPRDRHLIFAQGDSRQCHVVQSIDLPPDRAKYYFNTLSLVSEDSSIAVTVDPPKTQVFIYGNDATLRELSLSDTTTSNAITLSPAFASSTLTYNANVLSSATSIDVRAVVNDMSIRTEFDGIQATSPTAVYEVKINGGANSGSRVSLVAGANVVEIIVTPGDRVSETKTYTININRVVQFAPTITGTPALNYLENSDTPVATYSAEDVENDNITWSLSGTDMASFTLDNSGILTFNSSPNFENPADSDANNIYEVTLIATDDNATAPASSTLDVRVTVTNLDEDGSVIITGTAQVGRTLTAEVSDPDLSNDIVGFYEWRRGGRNIPGADGKTYTPVEADIGHILSVNVQYFDDSVRAFKEVSTVLATQVIAPTQVSVGYAFLFYNSSYEQGAVTTCVAISEPADGAAPAAFTLSTSTGGGNAIPGDDYNPVQDEPIVFAQGDRLQCRTVRFNKNPPDRGKYYINTLSFVSSDPSIAVTVTQPESGVYIQGNDATLRELSLSDATTSDVITLSPAFASSTLVYNANVLSSVSSVDVRAIVNDLLRIYSVNGQGADERFATYKVRVNGVNVETHSDESRANLIVGANVVEIMVTPGDEAAETTYTININRVVQSADNYLSDLMLENEARETISLDPLFTSSTTEYSANIRGGKVFVVPTTRAASATVSVDGILVQSGTRSEEAMLDVGNNIIHILVTASNGASRTYTLNVNRASSDADLSELTIPSALFISPPSFASSTLSYSADVETLNRNVEIRIAANHPRAVITRGDNVISSGVDTVNVGVGATTFTYTVTAEDGIATKEYTFIISRPAEEPIANAGFNQNVYSGESVTLNSSASSGNEDGDIEHYGWMQIQGTTVILSGSETAIATFIAPDVVDTIELVFRLSVTSTAGSSDRDTVFIDVNPALSFSDIIGIQTYTVGEATSLTLPVATGGRSPLTYTLEGLPNGLSFDADSRILSGTPTLVGTNNVIYTATDGRGVSVALEFMINIKNTPPTITGSADLNYPENANTPVATYSAIDAQNDNITWSLSGVDMASFTIDNSGVLTFNSPPNFENPADIDANNIYEVTLIVTDDNATPASSTLEVSVTVTNLGEDGIVTITGTAQVGKTLTAKLIDPDGPVNDGNASYQWQRGGENIIGANEKTYTPVEADIGSTLGVRVDYAEIFDGNADFQYAISDLTLAVIPRDPPIAPTIALFEDTGVDNDGITNNGVIFVSNLEDGATWQYSTNGGASFTQGGAISSGVGVSSFVLAEGVYSANQVQVRQITSGVTSTIVFFLSEITIDTTLIITIATPTLNIARDTSYIPTATINERGTLEISGDTLNTEVLGTYNITFTATDIATNSATATQVIIVGPTTPSAPRDLSATPGNGEVSLSWNVPDDDGESPITGYKIASKEADGVFSNFESIVGSNAETQTYTATDLTNGVTHTFKILAINSVGDGAESNEVSAAPIPTQVTVGYEFRDYQSYYTIGRHTVCAVITEPASGAPAPFTLSASTGGGNAIPGDDYTPVQNEHLIFAKGNERQCYTTSFINDPPDRAKYFINTLSLVSKDPSIAVTIDPATAAGIIWGNDATLRELALFDGTTSNVISLSPAFASSALTYNADVANSVLSVDIRAIVNDQVMSVGLPGHLRDSDGATYQVRVNNVDVETHSNESRADLEVGLNTVFIVVTSDRSQEILTYTININRVMQNADNYLSDLMLENESGDTISLDPLFTSSNTEYSANIRGDKIFVIPTTRAASTTVSVDGVLVPRGTRSEEAMLDVGNNIIRILVTASNGTSRTYTLNVRYLSSDASLSELTIPSALFISPS